MTNTITFTIFGKPAQMGSKKAFYIKSLKRSTIVDDNNKSKKAWAASVSQAASQVMGGKRLITGPVSLTVAFYFSRPKSHYGSGKNAGIVKPSACMHHIQSPDLDKLVRCLGDALTGIIYRDDRQVFALMASRHWTVSQERAVVSVTEIVETAT